MINIIKSEFQKSKRTSINKFITITPLFAVLISFLWGGGQNGAYNWWYVMFLPGVLAIISAQVMTRERKLSYKGLILYPQDKGMMWLGKIIYISILLIITTLLFMIGIMAMGYILGFTAIPFRQNLLATIVLNATFLFQIPISLFLTVKFNMFVAVLFNVGMTSFGVVTFATKSFYLFYSYGISSTLMVPVLGILPNGLPASGDSPLLKGGIGVGVVSNIILFLILIVITTIWFRNKEVN